MYVWVWVGVRGGRLEDMFSAVIICNTYGFLFYFYLFFIPVCLFIICLNAFDVALMFLLLFLLFF